MLYGILEEVPRDDIIEDGVPEELQPLVAVGHLVAVVGCMGECLEQVGPGGGKSLERDRVAMKPCVNSCMLTGAWVENQ